MGVHAVGTVVGHHRRATGIVSFRDLIDLIVTASAKLLGIFSGIRTNIAEVERICLVVHGDGIGVAGTHYVNLGTTLVLGGKEVAFRNVVAAIAVRAAAQNLTAQILAVGGGTQRVGLLTFSRVIDG